MQDNEREGAHKTQKVTDSAQRVDPVAEGTGDSTEAEECPETKRKTKNMRDRQRRGKKPHRRTTTGKPDPKRPRAGENCKKGDHAAKGRLH